MAIHLALVKGQINPDEPVTVRVHMENSLNDLLSGTLPEGSLPLRSAMHYFSHLENGVIVVLRKANKDEDLLRALGDINHATASPPPASQANSKMRTFGIGAQILKDLGISQMRVLGAPRKMKALSGFGLEVIEYLTPASGDDTGLSSLSTQSAD